MFLFQLYFTLSENESAEREEDFKGKSGDLRRVPEKPRGEHREVRGGWLLRVHAGGGRRKQRRLEVRGVQLSQEFSQEGGALNGKLLQLSSPPNPRSQIIIKQIQFRRIFILCLYFFPSNFQLGEKSVVIPFCCMFCGLISW